MHVGGARASRSDVSSEASERPAVSRVGGQQKGSNPRDGGEWTVRVGGSLSQLAREDMFLQTMSIFLPSLKTCSCIHYVA
jgi:hypothetical protein